MAEDLEERIIVTNWVLSPNSANSMSMKDEISGIVVFKIDPLSDLAVMPYQAFVF